MTMEFNSGFGTSTYTPSSDSDIASFSEPLEAGDPVEAYFACITTCSLDDGECITVCTEELRKSH